MKCANCGIDMGKPTPQEEQTAAKEFADTFPNVCSDEKEVICDKCYQEIMYWYKDSLHSQE